MAIELKVQSVGVYAGGFYRSDPGFSIVHGFAQILTEIEYKDWSFELHMLDVEGHAFLMARFTADGRDWTTRKYYLSPHMTRSEIIQTAFLCIKVAEEHETREKFLYRGKAIFGPHFDAEKLAALCEDPKHLDVRKG